MEKPKEEQSRCTSGEVKLTAQELQAISNLLFQGKWNLSIEENNRIIAPLINKISQVLDGLKK